MNKPQPVLVGSSQPKRFEIESELEALAFSVSELKSIMETLANRLTPALAQTPPLTRVETDAEPNTTAIGSKIRQSRDSVDGSVDVIKDILSRLEF